jgi:Spy/CpxP family protein refolding chaperone
MISTRNLSFALVTIILTIAFSMSVAAQDSGTGQQTAPPREGGHRGGPGGGRGDREGAGMMRMLADLNLTDAQKQQVHGILKSSNETNRPKQEEISRLRQQSEQGSLSADDQAKLKQLQAEVHAARQKTHEDIVAVLTPEQQAKLKEIEQQRKANRPGGEGRGQNAPPQ